MLVNPNIALFKDQINKYYVQAETFFKRAFVRPDILLNLRGNSAGTATAQKNLLRFNMTLFQHNQNHFLKQTVGHEVAHLIAYQVFGHMIKPHGKEWKYVMTEVFNLPPARCHQYTLTSNPRHYYLYRCQCVERIHHLTIRRHNFINKGRVYCCRYCAGTLSYLQKTTLQ